jgi:hypothetical protein
VNSSNTWFLFFHSTSTKTNTQLSKGSIKKYVASISCVSFLFLLAQLTFQIVLLSNPPYANEQILPNCSFKQEILEEFGFVRFDTTSILNILRLTLPDIFVLVVSLFTVFLCKKVNYFLLKTKQENSLYNNEATTKDTILTEIALGSPQTNNPILALNKSNQSLATSKAPSETESVSTGNRSKKTNKKSSFKRVYKFLLSIFIQLLFVILLFACGAYWPSLLSIPYFILFIVLVTRWSLQHTFEGTKFQTIVKISLLVYSALHIIIIYLYQLKLVREWLPPEQILARLLSLNNIFYTKCEDPGNLFLNPEANWQEMTYPFILLVFYWFVAVELAYSNETTNNIKQMSLMLTKKAKIPLFDDIDNNVNLKNSFIYILA